MKIEKISDTQIKLIMTNEELDEKDISIEGIRLSSNRTKEALNNLVRDIIIDSGMDVPGNSFISIDITNVSIDSVTFILSILNLESKSEIDALKMINDLFKGMGYGNDEEWEEYERELKKHLSFDENTNDEKSVKTVTKTKDKSSVDKKSFKPSESKTKSKPITYVFPNMEFIAKVASLFTNNKITFADSKVYKMDTKYFLILKKKSTTKTEKAEVILSEFGSKINYHEYVLEEHGELVIKKDALGILNKYF